MFGSGLVGFCLLVLALGFLGRPGLAHNGKMHSESLQETVVPEPAQCLVSRIYNLIRPAESKDDRSCWQDCFAKTDCHMAVVTKRISAAQQCLLVNCLNHGNHSLPRDPSAEITVYPKSTIDDELRANLMKRAHGAVDERLRCYERGCQSESPRFFYNTTSSRCERLFGGCGSNMKTFKTLKSCATLCHKKVRCYLPVEYGQTPPVGHLPFGPDNVSSTNADTTGKPKDTTVNFYFYNVSSGSCEGFHFRGSLSNGNLFQTVKECESLCGVKAAATSSPAVVSAAVTSPPAEDPGTTAAVPTKWRAAATSSPAVVSDIVIGVVVAVLLVVCVCVCVFYAVRCCREKSTNRYRLVGSHPDEQPLMGDDVAMTSVGGDGAVDMTRTFGVGDLGLDSHCNTSTNVSLRKTLNY